MKLGLYGGGFKPFTTGHFAKLANAIRDNDKVILFYGMQQAEPPRYGKRGQVLKTRQKFRNIGDTGRTYDEAVAREIFDIYSTALERIPGVSVVPVYSQAKDPQGNLASIRAPVTAIFKSLEDFVDNPGEVEKVTIYGDADSMRPYMMSPKFKSAVQSGKIQFGGAVPISPSEYIENLPDLMQRGEQEARSALKDFYASKGEDLDDEDILSRQTVRGTHVRKLASSADSTFEAKKYLPPFLNDQEKERIISILVGPISESVTTYVRAGDLVIPITKDVVASAASRFAIREQTETVSAPGEEAHIYNLYEEFSMPLSDIIEIGRLGLQGKLENVQEKMDGQFLAFTVVNGQLRFFTKMDLQGQAAKDKKLFAIQSGGKGGGMTLDEIMAAYTGGRSNIAEGFAIAYKALEPVALKYQDSLFRNGEVVIASQIMVSKNPNTILYDSDSLRTVLAISLTSEPVSQDVLNSFKSEMIQASTDSFTMDEVPTAKLMQGLEQDDSQIEQLEKDLEAVVSEVGMSIGSNTVGDYIKARLEKFLSEKYSFIPADLVPDVADRFMTGKGKIALRLKRVVSPEDYQKFRALDKVKPRIVQEAIIPLENIIQRLGVLIIDKLDLALTASNQEQLLGFIKDVRAAFESGFDFGLEAGDTKTLEGIRVALARLEANEDFFQRATEGIVFTYKGKTYKLTGLFTPINKMRGFFGSAMGREGFGKATLPMLNKEDEIRESLKKIISNILLEGGNAFKKKDESGVKTVVTSKDRISRDQAVRIIDDLKRNLLDPLGIEFLPAGSTGTNKKEIGDIDLIVSEPSKDKLYKDMTSAPYLEKELVPGVPRVLKIGQLVAIMVQDHQTGQLFQVDLFPSISMDSTDWELSGGGEGKVKGEYHKLMLSLLAKIKGERESTSEKTVKYTLSFPGGWREKINGQENHDGRIFDPDNYLGLIGISDPKESVRTFEDLVVYMMRNMNPEFEEALSRFEDYVSQRLRSKSEKVRAEAEKAVNTIKGFTQAQLSETNLRKIISGMI